MRTNAPALTFGTVSLINSDAVTVNSFAPIPVPEPGAGLALAALAGAVLLRRRRSA